MTCPTHRTPSFALAALLFCAVAQANPRSPHVEASTPTPDGGRIDVGSFSGRVVLGAGEEGATELASEGCEDAFVARYRADGRIDWAVRAGGPGFQEAATAVALAPSGQIYVGGQCHASARFGAGEANETLAGGPAGTNAFLARFTADGAFEWVRVGGGDDYDYGVGIALDSAGHCALVGTFRRSASFATDARETSVLRAASACAEIFLAIYDEHGDLRRSTSMGGPDRDLPTSVRAGASGGWTIRGRIATLRSDSHAVFGAGETGETTLYAREGREFVARFDSNGRLECAHQLGADPRLALR